MRKVINLLEDKVIEVKKRIEDFENGKLPDISSITINDLPRLIIENQIYLRELNRAIIILNKEQLISEIFQ